jgi:hypothetical protein
MSQMLLDWLQEKNPELAELWTKKMGNFDPENVVDLSYVLEDDGEPDLDDVRRIVDDLAWFVDDGGTIYIDVVQLDQEAENVYFNTIDLDNLEDWKVNVATIKNLTFVPQANRDWTITKGFIVIPSAPANKKKSSR